MDINDLIRAAYERKASDLHLKAGNHACIRVNGNLESLIQFPALTNDAMGSLTTSIISERQMRKFQEKGDLDVSYAVAGLGRFRVNIARQRGSIALALRVIPPFVASFEELHLPSVLVRFTEERRGMVLVTGTTGSGKTTTLAAMIDSINAKRSERIVTIEDPIEFLHRDRRSFITQREVEVDTASFGAALRAALRQDPDVILLGEMRDRETIETALIAAETGHLLFSTVHTLDATETIQRTIAVFPPPDQQQIRLQLAATLRGIISLRLLKRADGNGRVPAAEVLITTEYIRDCIVNPEKTHLIHDALAAGTSQYGMQTFDQSIYDLYSQKLITLEEALQQASKPDEFKLRVSGVRSTADAVFEQLERQVKGGVVKRF
ncbi:MAG: type IV pilus twitching motility protein PilT [Terriglobia bacterium]